MSRAQLRIYFPGEKEAVANGPAVFHRRRELPHLRAAENERVGHPLRCGDESGAFDGAGFRDDHFYDVRSRGPSTDRRRRQRFRQKSWRPHVFIVLRVKGVVESSCNYVSRRRHRSDWDFRIDGWARIQCLGRPRVTKVAGSTGCDWLTRDRSGACRNPRFHNCRWKRRRSLGDRYCPLR